MMRSPPNACLQMRREVRRLLDRSIDGWPHGVRSECPTLAPSIQHDDACARLRAREEARSPPMKTVQMRRRRLMLLESLRSICWSLVLAVGGLHSLAGAGRLSLTDDALSVEDLLRDDGRQATQQVTIAVNDDDLEGGGDRGAHISLHSLCSLSHG